MKKFLTTAAKAQVSAFIGGLVDWIVMIVLTDYGNILYSFSMIISGFTGAVVNYSINRQWTFDDATHEAKMKQLPKFLLMVMGSVFLKSIGTTLLTENFDINYKISRLFVDIFVSVGFNFMLQRFWIFRTPQES